MIQNSRANQLAEVEENEMGRVMLKKSEQSSKVIHIQKVKAKPSDKTVTKQARACRPQGE